MLPFIVYFVIYAFKEYWIWNNERKFDDIINHQYVDTVNLESSKIEEKVWEDINLGDFVILKKGFKAPADILILDCSSNSALVYPTNISGSTSVYRKFPIQSVNVSNYNAKGNPLYFKEALNGKIEYSAISEFDVRGFLKLKTDPKGEEFTEKNIIFREEILNGCDWIFGIALFVGYETQIYRRCSKFSFRFETNWLWKIDLSIILIVVFLGLLSFMMSNAPDMPPYFISKPNILGDWIKMSIATSSIFPILRSLLSIILANKLEREYRDIDLGLKIHNPEKIDKLGSIDIGIFEKTGVITKTNSLSIRSLIINEDLYIPSEKADPENYEKLKLKINSDIIKSFDELEFAYKNAEYGNCESPKSVLIPTTTFLKNRKSVIPRYKEEMNSSIQSLSNTEGRKKQSNQYDYIFSRKNSELYIEDSKGDSDSEYSRKKNKELSFMSNNEFPNSFTGNDKLKSSMLKTLTVGGINESSYNESDIYTSTMLKNITWVHNYHSNDISLTSKLQFEELIDLSNMKKRSLPSQVIGSIGLKFDKKQSVYTNILDKIIEETGGLSSEENLKNTENQLTNLLFNDENQFMINDTIVYSLKSIINNIEDDKISLVLSILLLARHPLEKKLFDEMTMMFLESLGFRLRKVQKAEELNTKFNMFINDDLIEFNILAMNNTHSDDSINSEKFSIILHEKKSEYAILLVRGTPSDLLNKTSLTNEAREKYAELLRINEKMGLNMMCVCYTTISLALAQEFVSKKALLMNNITNNDSLFKLYEEIEEDLKLALILGYSETLNERSDAIVKTLGDIIPRTWIISGDSERSMISCLYNLRASEEIEKIWKISGESSDDLKEVVKSLLSRLQKANPEIKRFQKSFSSSDSKRNSHPILTIEKFILLVDGKSFETIMNDEYLKSHFFLLAYLSQMLVGFEMNSEMKDSLIINAKSFLPCDPNIMYVGNTFNDIQAMKSADLSFCVNSWNKDYFMKSKLEEIFKSRNSKKGKIRTRKAKNSVEKPDINRSSTYTYTKKNENSKYFLTGCDIRVSSLMTVTKLLLFEGNNTMRRFFHSNLNAYLILFIAVVPQFLYSYYAKFRGVGIFQSSVYLFIQSIMVFLTMTVSFLKIKSLYSKKFLCDFPNFYSEGSLFRASYGKILMLNVIVPGVIIGLLFYLCSFYHFKFNDYANGRTFGLIGYQGIFSFSFCFVITLKLAFYFKFFYGILFIAVYILIFAGYFDIEYDYGRFNISVIEIIYQFRNNSIYFAILLFVVSSNMIYLFLIKILNRLGNMDYLSNFIFNSTNIQILSATRIAIADFFFIFKPNLFQISQKSFLESFFKNSNPDIIIQDSFFVLT